MRVHFFPPLLYLAASAASSASAAQLPPPPQDLYGLEVLDSAHWIREADVLGAPLDIRCTGTPRDWAAQTGSPAGQIHIFNCEPVQLGPNDVVTNVWVDVLARYADDLSGPLELEIKVPHHIDPATPRLRRLRTCVSNSPAGNCRWRFNSSGSPDGTSIYNDIVGLYGQSFPWELVHTLDLLVRGVNPNCGANDSNLQLKAVRMVVETITDCNGNGFHDPDESGYKDDNGNGIWDICDEGYRDCNGNDCWDNFEPFYSDLNSNGHWDICDAGYMDCDGNHLWDEYEVGYEDCNQNNVADACDISGSPGLDCDGSGGIDSCEIDDDGSLDLNGNGVIDSCEYAGTPYCLNEAVANSTGEHALLVAIGTDSLSSDNLDLWCGRMPPGANGYFLVSQSSGTVVMAGGSMGTLCIAGPSLGRYANFVFQATADGLTSMGVDATMIPQPMGPIAASAGQTWNFQCWYRDTVNMMATSNHSNAVRVTFTP